MDVWTCSVEIMYLHGTTYSKHCFFFFFYSEKNLPNDHKIFLLLFSSTYVCQVGTFRAGMLVINKRSYTNSTLALVICTYGGSNSITRNSSTITIP